MSIRTPPPPKKKTAVYTSIVPCKNSKIHEVMIPEVLLPGGNPLKEVMNYAPACYTDYRIAV